VHINPSAAASAAVAERVVVREATEADVDAVVSLVEVVELHVSVHPENRRAISFYMRRGFTGRYLLLERVLRRGGKG